MKSILIKWVVLAASVFLSSVACKLLGLGFEVSLQNSSGAVEPAKVLTLLIGVAVLAFLNATLGKILKLVALPISCLTLGLFAVLINGAVLYFAASLNLGFRFTGTPINSFFAAIAASVFISMINGILIKLLPDGKE